MRGLSLIQHGVYTPSRHILCRQCISKPLVWISLQRQQCLGTLGNEIPESPIFEASQPVWNDLQTYGIGNPYSFVGGIENVMQMLHVWAGLPWWMSIVAYAALLKVALLPLSIRQMRANVNMANIRPQLAEINANARQFRLSGQNQVAATESMKAQQLMVQHDCHPFKIMLYSLAPAPLFICSFMALRELCLVRVPSLMEGGVLWFTDLTICDPTYLLPIASSIALFLNFEASRWINPQMPWGLYMFMIVVSTISVPVTGSLSSAIVLYFVAQNACNLIVSLLWRIKAVRNFFLIPELIRPSTPLPLSPGFIASFREGYQMRMSEAAKANQFTDARNRAIEAGPVQVVRKGGQMPAIATTTTTTASSHGKLLKQT